MTATVSIASTVQRVRLALGGVPAHAIRPAFAVDVPIPIRPRACPSNERTRVPADDPHRAPAPSAGYTRSLYSSSPTTPARARPLRAGRSSSRTPAGRRRPSARTSTDSILASTPRHHSRRPREVQRWRRQRQVVEVLGEAPPRCRVRAAQAPSRAPRCAQRHVRCPCRRATRTARTCTARRRRRVPRVGAEGPGSLLQATIRSAAHAATL